MNVGLVFNRIRNNHWCIPNQHELVPNLKRNNHVENILTLSSVDVYWKTLDINKRQTHLSPSEVAVTDKNLLK